MMRTKLEAHMAFLTKDDHALRGSSSTSPDYSQVPEAGPILAEISSQRGLRCCELESSDMFESEQTRARESLDISHILTPVTTTL